MLLRNRHVLIRVLSSLVLIGGVFTALAVTAGPASAVVDIPGPGPAAAIDSYGHRYVFWKGTNGGLWEGYYNGTRWFGPINVDPGANMGSEPTVAVSASQHTGGSNPSAYQFVFWKGAGSAHNLIEEYFDGSWHGPFDIGMGNVGGYILNQYAPSASWYDSTGIIVAWTGATDTNIWYTFTKSPTNTGSWSSPQKSSHGNVAVGSEPSVFGPLDSVFWADSGFQDLWWGALQGSSSHNYHDGPLGGPPTSTAVPNTECVCDDYYAFWQGATGGLWYMTWSAVNLRGPSEVCACQLGSDPSIALDAFTPGPSSISQAEVYWRCPNDQNLCQRDMTGRVTDLDFGPIPSEG